MQSQFRIEPLARHDRLNFSCGVESLDRYIKQQVSQDVKRLVASCFVLTEAEKDTIIGYYTLAATSIPADGLSPDVIKKLPRYPVLPAVLVGRLAIDQRFHNKGFGAVLLADAAKRVLNGDVSAMALIVDAKDENAANFYKKYGFIAFRDRPMSMYLPLATVAKAAV